MKQIVKTLIALVVFSTLLSAQNLNKSNVKNYDKFLTNLKKSMVSEAPGIQQSAIKLAGKHKVKEVVSTLEDLLEDTTNEKTKILIAEALFDIGEKSSIEMLVELAMTEESQYLKHFYNSLCKKYFEKQQYTKAL